MLSGSEESVSANALERLKRNSIHLQTFAILSSSVATTTLSNCVACKRIVLVILFLASNRIEKSSEWWKNKRASEIRTFIACSYVLTIIGLPRIIVRGLPGNRVEAYRAGITPSCCRKEEVSLKGFCEITEGKLGIVVGQLGKSEISSLPYLQLWFSSS